MTNGQTPTASPDRIAHEWKVLDGVQKLIERADMKATVVLGIDTVLVGVLVAQFGTLRALWKSSDDASLGFWVCILAILVFVGLLGAGVYKLVGVVLPRMGTGERKTAIFAGHIHAECGDDHTKYSTKMEGHSDQKWAEDLDFQIVENSRIAVVKMNGIKRALQFTLAAIAAWAVALCLLRLLAPEVA